MRVVCHIQVRSYSCLQDILCKKIMSVGDVSVGEEKVTPMAVRCQQIFFGRKKLPTSGHG